MRTGMREDRALTEVIRNPSREDDHAMAAGRTGETPVAFPVEALKAVEKKKAGGDAYGGMDRILAAVASSEARPEGGSGARDGSVTVPAATVAEALGSDPETLVEALHKH